MGQDEYLEKLLENVVEEGETFQFRCTACGKCCRHRDDLLLSPYDVFRISRYLKMSTGEFLEKYCVGHVGWVSRAPLMYLRMEGKERVCPFLEGRSCLLQGEKPTICALYPLGRAGQGTDKILYFLQEVDCGERDESHTVKEWMDGYDLTESEEFFVAWQKVVVRMSVLLHGLEKRLPGDCMRTIMNYGFAMLYPNCDSGQPFLPQFQKKAEEFLYFLELASSRVAERDALV